MQTGYSRKINSISTPTTFQLLRADIVYQFTQIDQDHFKCLQDYFLKGKQCEINKNTAWMYKDQKDFRYKIYTLISDIAKSNQTQLANLKSQKDFFQIKANYLQDLFNVFFQDLKTLKFDHTKSLLNSKQFANYNSTMINLIKPYTEQLNEIQRISQSFKEIKQKQQQISIYKIIIDSLDNPPKLSHYVSQYQKNKIIDNFTLQKLLTLTSKLQEHKNPLQQKSSNRWLKHFLAILSQNFDQQKIISLQNTVNQEPENIELKNTMKTLKIYCSRKGQQAIFVQKLKKMKINNYNSVCETYQTAQNITDKNQKKKCNQIFQKQLALQILENQNYKTLNKNQSFVVKTCNQYFTKINTGKHKIYLPEKQESSLLEIKQRLKELEQIIDSNKKQSLNDSNFIFQKEGEVRLSNQILTLIERISHFMKNQGKNTQSSSLIKQTQSFFGSNKQISDSKTNENKFKQTQKIRSKNIEQVLILKNDINKAIGFLKQKASQKRYKISYYQQYQYYQISFQSFNKFTKTVTDINNKIQQILKDTINNQPKSIKPQLTKSNFSKCQQDRVNKKSPQQLLNQSQIKSLTQQLRTNKIYYENNLKENTLLKNTIKTLQLATQKLQKQNIKLNQQLKKLQASNLQWQKYAKQLKTQIENAKTQINEKQKQLFDQTMIMQIDKKQIKLIKQQLQKQVQKLNEKIILQQQQIHKLSTQIKNQKQQINSKDTIFLNQQTQIKNLQNEKTQLINKISQNEASITEKRNQLQRSLNQLKNKQILIKQLQKDKTENLEKITLLQEKITKLQEENQKLSAIPQKRLPNFRSFNTNPREKSALKTTAPPKKQTSPLKTPQTSLNTKKAQNNNKTNLNNLPKINEIEAQYGVRKEFKNLENKLKLSESVFNQKFIPPIKTIIEPVQNNVNDKISTNNSKLTEEFGDQKIMQRQIAANIKQKQFQFQQRYTNLMNEKQQITEKLNSQILKLTKQSEQLNSRIKQSSEQNEENKQENQRLIKSNQKLREQSTQNLNINSNLKKQKQSLQQKLKQLLTQQQKKHQNIPQQNQQTLTQQNQIQQIQQNLQEKCNLITQMEKNIKEISHKVSQLENDKITLQKTIQNLKIQQQQTVKKYEQKDKIKPETNQIKPKQQNATTQQLEALKKEFKIKVLTLELELQEKTEHYDELYRKYKKQTADLTNKIQALTSAAPGLQTEITTLKEELNKKQQTLNTKEKEIENLSNKIAELQKFIQKQKNDFNKFEQEAKELKKENESAQRQLSRLNKERDTLESENYTLKDKLRDQKKLNKQEIEKMKKEQAKEIKDLRLQNARKLQEARRQIKSIQYAQKFKTVADTNNESNAYMRLEFQKTKNDLQMELKRTKRLEQKIKEMNNQILSLKKILQEKEKQIKTTQQDAKFMNSSMKQLQQTLALSKDGINKTSTVIYDRFFQNSALDQQFTRKYLLYDLIQQKVKKNIKKTTLMYHFDHLNKTNFHNYIDGKQNLIVIVRTSKGNVFGGFSTSKMQRGYKDPVNTVSFIFAFDSQDTIEHFNIDDKKNLNIKSFDWDEYFFVFGNAEIRWRFGEKAIYSNFAIQNGFYETKGKNVSALLKQGNSRDTEIDALDFYQVVFEQ